MTIEALKGLLFLIIIRNHTYGPHTPKAAGMLVGKQLEAYKGKLTKQEYRELWIALKESFKNGLVRYDKKVGFTISGVSYDMEINRYQVARWNEISEGSLHRPKVATVEGEWAPAAHLMAYADALAFFLRTRFGSHYLFTPKDLVWPPLGQ
jgi:hypothetical protein